MLYLATLDFKGVVSLVNRAGRLIQPFFFSQMNLLLQPQWQEFQTLWQYAIFVRCIFKQILDGTYD